MKRPQLQSLKEFASGLTASVIAMLPVLRLFITVTGSVLLLFGSMIAVGYGTWLLITSVIDVLAMSSVGQFVLTIMEQFEQLLVDAFALPGAESATEPTRDAAERFENPPWDEPEHGSQGEEMAWELLETAYNFLFMAVVVIMMLFAMLSPIVKSANSETDRIEPMTLDELEEHYESQYANGEITKEEHDERIEKVYQAKGLEDDDQ